MTVYIGTSSGNKILVDPAVGTLAGNLDIQEIWVGTPTGNELVFQRVLPMTLTANAASSTQVNLTWTDVQADVYYLYRNGTLIYTGPALYKLDIGLAANTTYNYTVNAVKGGVQIATATAAATTKLAPITLSATPNSQTQITLTWSNVGADLYKLYRGATEIYSDTLLTKIDTGLTANTSYNYRIDAYKGGVVSTTTTVTAITNFAPITLTATPVSSTQINLSWTNVGAGGYKLYSGATAIYGEATGLSFNHTGLTPNSTYDYRIDALRGGVMNVSDTETAKTQPSPITLTATSTVHNMVNLSWSNVGAGVTYQVFRGATSVYGPGPLTATTDGGVTGNKAYTYRVDAIQNSTVIASDTETVTTPFQPITLTAAVNSQTQVTLTWNSIGADSYQVFRGATSIYGPGPLLTKVDTGLTANTPYAYRVDAIYQGAVVKQDSESVRTSLTQIALTATPASSTAINLSWTNVGAASYTLLRGATTIVPPGTALSYSDTGLAANQSYGYTIRATSADGTISSDTKTASTNLGAITLSAAAASKTQIDLSWTDNGADNYKVTEGATVIYGPGTLFAASHTGLGVNTPHSYRVDAYKGGVSHAYSTASATTQNYVEVRKEWSAYAADTQTYNQNGTERTDNTNMYYGYYSSSRGVMKSQARWDIPAAIRGSRITKINLRWWNNHTYWNSGGTVSICVHHNPSLGSTYGGSTAQVTNPNNQNKTQYWPAGKPGWINGTEWFEIGWLNCPGRYSVFEEFRTHGAHGFQLSQGAGTATEGYGHAAPDPMLYIEYYVLE
jgi:trimeric autotransporter adhesin